MSDRFSGNVRIGGIVGKADYDTLASIINPILEDDIDQDYPCFCDCRYSDFDEVKLFCEERNIALAIYWDAKYEYGSHVEFIIDESEYGFNTDSNGRIVVTLEHLRQNEHMSIPEFIKSLDVPEFPKLEVQS